MVGGPRGEGEVSTAPPPPPPSVAAPPPSFIHSFIHQSVLMGGALDPGLREFGGGGVGVVVGVGGDEGGS